MIDRYTRPEMGHIFSLENKYAIWQEIEVLACEAHAEIGESGNTADEARWIRDHAAFDKDEVDAIEAVTNHDVISFLTNMGSYIDRDTEIGRMAKAVAVLRDASADRRRLMAEQESQARAAARREAETEAAIADFRAISSSLIGVSMK